MQLSRLFSLGLVMGLALTLSACGGKEEKKDSGETKKDGGSSGTEKTSGEKLVGKWSVDMSAMLGPVLAMMEGQLAQAPEEAKAEIQKQIAQVKEAKMEMEFTADGKMIGTQVGGPEGGKTENGTYEIKSSEGNKVIMTSKMGDDGKDEEVTLTFVDDDTIEFQPPNGPKMTAKRVK